MRIPVYHKDTPASTTCFFTENKKTVLDFIPGVLTPHPRKVVPSVPGVLDTEFVVGEARFELACHIGGVYSAGGYPVTLYSPLYVYYLSTRSIQLSSVPQGIEP